MSNRILIDIEDRIAIITINRPEKRNALDVPTRKELRSTLETIADDDDVRVLVFRGAGDGSFVSGGDISTLAELDAINVMAYKRKYAQGLNNYIAAFPKPTIAAIDGYALGGGMEVALACDIRLGRKDVKVGFPEVKLGIFPGGGGTQRLVTEVGAGKAKELILTGRIIDAAEAHEIGLLNNVYSREEFQEAVESLSAELAENAPLAMQFAKRSINRGLDLEGGLDFELLAGSVAFGTEDKQEGMRAFLEDREPMFEGK